MGEETRLAFKSEEDRLNALNEIPDEPPPGVNIEDWQREQEEKGRSIMDAPIDPESEPPPQTAEDTPPEKKVEQPQPIEEEYVDFSALGKMKRDALPENLRKYKNPQEILKQADHARMFANKADEKIRKYEDRIAELESTAKTVPELQKQLDDLKKASEDAQRSVDSKQMGKQERKDFNEQLTKINSSIEKLRSYDGEDAKALESAISSTVDVFKGTLSELDTVKTEFTKYRSDTERKQQALEKRLNELSETTTQAEKRRQEELEQENAIRGLEELQNDYPELKTSMPLISNDKKDVEGAIVKLSQRIYGRKVENFDEVNRVVSAFNAKDAELTKIMEQEGISAADFGINDKDIRNYGILMDVYWQQRGQRINPSSGKREDVNDWRGQKVTFPDFESVFLHMKESGGITQAEKEAAILEAEKRGQESLDASLKKRDISPPVLDPTGAPPEGQEMNEEAALEIIGVNPGSKTIDEERMEMLCRIGDKRGWAMFEVYQNAHKALNMEIPRPEPHWKSA